MESCWWACWPNEWPRPLFFPEEGSLNCLHDARWAVVAYLLHDIIRAIDPAPGLSDSLRDVRALQRELETPPRMRKRQGERITTVLLA